MIDPQSTVGLPKKPRLWLSTVDCGLRHLAKPNTLSALRPLQSPNPMTDISRIRNFSIIAHIDHGKSTLADRLLERTGAIAARDMREQVLDSMDLERERGITIKAQAVRLHYTSPRTGIEYILNLIDTPGHVDFSYEVSRSLAACEGAILLVDAAQGVEAQTLANAYLAIEGGLEVIPVLNKLDLPSADPERVALEVAGVLGGDPNEVLRVSAKTGEGIDELLEAIVDRLPPPAPAGDGTLRALVFDSHYDIYRGVVCYVRVTDGVVNTGDPLRFMATGRGPPRRRGGCAHSQSRSRGVAERRGGRLPDHRSEGGRTDQGG